MTDLYVYEEIPAYPETHTAGTVLGRIIDSLGFRYHWATEGLSEQELGYEPGGSGRSLRETLNHIYSLAVLIECVLDGRQLVPEPAETMPFDELRRRTLERVKRISEQLKATPAETFDELPVRFRRGEKDHEFPFWHAINGPIADALYHAGQVVAYRRAAGNPIDPQVNVFMGKKMDP